MNRRAFPADLKRMKLVHGDIRSCQFGNLTGMMWGDRQVVTLLSTKTPPDPEIQAVEVRINGTSHLL